jgi:subtilisin-like proprotein convertase family protein
MTYAGKLTRLLIAGTVTAGALALFAGTAMAGTASYPSTGTFGVPNNTGQAGVPSQVFVPPGRTAVQTLQLTQVKPSFGGGGGGDLQLRLKSPSGTEISVLSNGCTTYPNTSAFNISDSATLSVDSAGFCTALTGAPTTTSGKPTQPLSTFSGTPSAGTWTVTVVDVGVSATLGSWNGWTLQVNHADPTVKAAAAGFKVKKKFALAATCDADCTVTTGGAAKASTTKLGQNIAGVIVASPTKKAKKKGKGVVTLTATDQTGGTATTSIKLKVGK